MGYPVWAASVPQAVLSFLEQYDLSGKTVIPFCTHDGLEGGRRTFENGDITYCEAHHNMAVLGQKQRVAV